MKKLLTLLLAVLFFNIPMINADNIPQKDCFNGDEVFLDQDIKPLLMHAFFSKNQAILAAKRLAGYPTPKPLRGVNRQGFKQFSNTYEASLNELVCKCQKHSAHFDVMGTPFSCHTLEEFLVMTELNPSVLEVNDWYSFLSGGYSKKVSLSSQAIIKLKKLRQNITDAGSVRAEGADWVRAQLNTKKPQK